MASSTFGEGLSASPGVEQPHIATMLVRTMLEQSQKFTHHIEAALHVNETDFKAMEALMENGPMTAGQLARAIGVSPGAVTSVIDRLVAVGHVSRQHDATDRRKVLVLPNPKSVDSAWSHLAPIIATSEGTIRKMEAASQQAVIDYLEAMIEAFSRVDFSSGRE